MAQANNPKLMEIAKDVVFQYPDISLYPIQADTNPNVIG